MPYICCFICTYFCYDRPNGIIEGKFSITTVDNKTFSLVKWKNKVFLKFEKVFNQASFKDAILNLELDIVITTF